MGIYLNRVRHSYLRRRSRREMAVATVAFVFITLLIGHIAYLDQKTREDAARPGVRVAAQ